MSNKECRVGQCSRMMQITQDIQVVVDTNDTSAHSVQDDGEGYNKVLN